MIKRLYEYLGEYKYAAYVSPLCMLGEVAMEVMIPAKMAVLIDSGIMPRDMGVVVREGLWLVVYALFSLFFGVFSAYLASHSGTGFARNLRHDMFYRVQNFSFSNIDKFSTGSIITRITTDVTRLQMTYQMAIRMAIRCPVMIVMALFMAFRISAKLSIVYCIAMPLLGFGLIFVATRVHKIFERMFKRIDKMNSVVQENIHGIRVVKSFVRGDKEVEKFTAVSSQMYDDAVKAERILALNNPMMRTAVSVCTMVVSFLGAKLIVQSGNNAANGLTTGQLSTMFTYTTQILGGLMMLSMVFVMSIMSRASMYRVCELLDEVPDIQNPENPVMEVKNGDIDFENVSFRYSTTAEKDTLENLNLHIKAGQTVGILGGTGAAKSSLVQLIPRLYDINAGSLKVGGVDVRDYDLEVLRNEVAMVLQKNVLFSGTIKENLRWGNPDATQEEMEHACKLACAHDFITQFPNGYDTMIEQGGTNVSGGQRQRLCIARALLKKPKILILDDSTSAVDTHTDAMIRKAFLEEIPNTTKLIIAQRVASVQESDVIVVLDNGKIVDVGTHEELLQTSSIYREVYESQTKGDE